MRFGHHNASFHHDTDEPSFEALVSFIRRLEARFDWISTMDTSGNSRSLATTGNLSSTRTQSLPALAQATQSVEISALVTLPHYRNPVLLGRILTTLVHVSGGRAVLSIGAG